MFTLRFIRLNPAISIKFTKSNALLRHLCSPDNSGRLTEHNEALLGKGHCHFYCTAETNIPCRSVQLCALQRDLPLCLFQGPSHPATVICNYGFLAQFPSRPCHFLFLLFFWDIFRFSKGKIWIQILHPTSHLCGNVPNCDVAS